MSTLRVLGLSAVKLSGGGAKPTWSIPKNQMWHPQIPDRHHYGENPSFNGFVLWIRGVRPYLEKMFADTYNTSKTIFYTLYTPTQHFVQKRNPSLKLQLAALLSFATTSSLITYYLSDYYQQLVDITNYVELGVAKDMEADGFWLSQSEDMEKRNQDYANDHARYNHLWETAIQDATINRSFETLVSYLKVDENELPEGVPQPISFRFNMIPYGDNNPDTQTFPTPSNEQPLRAFALNFTYNNLSGNWGDYIHRLDNKSAALRSARQMFADVYIPGTK